MADKRKQVKFTIIIPTRERCDVLYSSLKTCTAQEYDNLEIIVSDNFSKDNTREIVESFKDKRIRYINTGKRMNMADNWEFALTHVNSGYLSYIGDDDGLLQGALKELNEIINTTGCEAVSCKPAVYFWPDYINKPRRNILVIPLQSSLEKRNSKKMLFDVINFTRSHNELPLLYRGFVSYNAIKKAQDKSGRFFHSINPDIYSSIALACVLESYYYSLKPYVISGASHHSIGALGSIAETDNQTAKIFFSENNPPYHNKLSMAPSTPIIVAESFLQAQDHIPCAKHFKIDIKKCIEIAIKEAVYSPKEKYESVIDAIKEIARLNQINDYLPGIIKKYKNKPAAFDYPVLGVNISSRQVVVNCTEFGAQNVYQAAVLCRHILALKKLNYFSLIGIIKTTLALIKREISNRFITTNR